MRNQKVCKQKPKLTSFGNSELETKIRETFKARLGAKRKTVEMYALTLARFCKSENVEPFDFETLDFIFKS